MILLPLNYTNKEDKKIFSTHCQRIFFFNIAFILFHTATANNQVPNLRLFEDFMILLTLLTMRMYEGTGVSTGKGPCKRSFSG
jgi:hypothetical protein